MAAATVATAATAATAASAPQARPTATPSRTPVAADRRADPRRPGHRHAAARRPDADRQIDRLPPEALDTIRLIARNGPFPYRQDGVVFENRERLLPAKATGYYHEYTVKTPARRIAGRGGSSAAGRMSSTTPMTTTTASDG